MLPDCPGIGCVERDSLLNSFFAVMSLATSKSITSVEAQERNIDTALKREKYIYHSTHIHVHINSSLFPLSISFFVCET